jgi:GT2 family glycosyltransferase
MSDTPVLSIVVPVVDQAGLTVQCFYSVRKNTTLPFELIWVDNGSCKNDFTIIERQARLPDTNCRVIVNKENMGFIKGVNQGIREARGQYIVILNNDTEVTPGWDVQLIKPLMHFSDVGAVGPITFKSAWQTPEGISTNLKIHLHKDGLSMPHFLQQIKPLRNEYVDVTHMTLSFFCVAMRREIFDKIGVLCEELSIGLGDDDEYCMRMRKYGYRLLLSLGTFVHHVHRATFNSLKLGEDSLRRYNLKIIRKKYGRI